MREGAARDQDHSRTAPSSDLELVDRIQGGDLAAEHLFYERYSERLYYLALVKVRFPQDAEDVRSETFLRVLSAIRNHQLQEPLALARFCMRTLDHVAFELLRKQQRAARYALEAPALASIDEYFVDEGVSAAIERVLARLKPREREFLRMYYYEELPKDEIAHRTGIAGERVRLLKSRALKSFREIYLRLRNADTKRPRRTPE